MRFLNGFRCRWVPTEDKGQKREDRSLNSKAKLQIVSEVVDDIFKQSKGGREFFKELMAELTGYQIRTSPVYPDFVLDDIFNDAYDHRIIKKNTRKQVIFIKTDSGNFFIKFSFLSRQKDRFRHLVLPRRRWAEWRNLHKLGALGLDAAQPVICGQRFNQEPNSFFIVTKAIKGSTMSRERELNALSLGGFFAKLHRKGFYYADLHPGNIIIKPDGQPVLIDAQEIFFLKWIPGRLRSYNLGRLYLALKSRQPDSWFEEFLRTYNHDFKKSIHIRDIREASIKHYKKHIKSRTKRCLKNSSEFEAVKTGNQKIYRRKDFAWEKADILNAIKNGIDLKENKVFAHNSVCIKVHSKGRLHKDRCLASWKNSRALDIRGINIPRAMGYYRFDQKSFFLAEYLNDGIPLHKYLPTLAGGKSKRKTIKQLALWVRNIHHHQIWQKDFNATNVLYANNQFVLLDLDNVKFEGLSETQKIQNLAQLNASASDEIRLKDRIRFFYYYFDGQWPDRYKRRKIYQTIWEITLTKNTAVFGLDTSDPGSFNIPE